MGGLEKGPANLLRGKRITKKDHTGRGQEAKWEIPVKDPLPVKNRQKSRKNLREISQSLEDLERGQVPMK
jgi:hypothetical protein